MNNGRRDARGWRGSRTAAPKSVADLLGTALGSFTLRKKAREYAAFPHWREIVGDDIANVAKPVKIIRGRVLHVQVIDAVWAQELSLMKGRIIDDIHRSGKGAMVEDIKFTIGDPKSFKE